MVFVPPTWYMGSLIWALFYIPVILCLGFCFYNFYRFVKGGEDMEKYGYRMIICFVLAFVFTIVCTGVGGYVWHEVYEIPSIEEKVVTVDEWQVKPDVSHTEDGMMVIDNANQLMLITTDGESFINDENFLFQKFDTRDILNNVKPGSVVKLKYYGWREGYNSGFPNILSVEVINDTNASNTSLSDYFGTKLFVNG